MVRIPQHRREQPHLVVPMASVGYFLVTSGRSGKQYKVTPSEDGLVSCECLWYLEHSRGKSRAQLLKMQHCSHIEACLKYAERWKNGSGKRRYVRS